MKPGQKSYTLFCFEQSDDDEISEALQTKSNIQVMSKNINRLFFNESQDSDKDNEKQIQTARVASCIYSTKKNSKRERKGQQNSIKDDIISSNALKPSIMSVQPEMEPDYDQLVRLDFKNIKPVQHKKILELSFIEQSPTAISTKPVIHFVEEYFFDQLTDNRDVDATIKIVSLAMSQVTKQLNPYQQTKPLRYKESNILEPDEQMLHFSRYFNQLIQTQKSFQERSNFLVMPILQGARLIFQVYIYTDFIDKSYQFWYEKENGSRQFLMSAKKSLYLMQSQFYLMQYIEESQQLCFAAKLISNLNGDQYNIYSQEENIKDLKSKIWGTVSISVSMSGDKSIIFYYPKVDATNSPQEVYRSSISKNLNDCYKERTNDSITYLMSCKIQEDLRLKVMKQFDLKSSKKMIQFKDEKGRVNLFIGKKRSKCYKVIAGGCLSPIQIFSLLISHVEG